jgi:hypothetical protein
MSCSTTITVFPDSTRPSSCVISFATSDGCKPVVGSSRTYSVSPVCARCSSLGRSAYARHPLRDGGVRLFQRGYIQTDLGGQQRPAREGSSEEIKRAVHRHREDVGNRLIPDIDLASWRCSAHPCGRTGRVDARQKSNSTHTNPSPGEFRTGPCDIERETARIVPPSAALLGGGKSLRTWSKRPVYVADSSAASAGGFWSTDQPLDTVRPSESRRLASPQSVQPSSSSPDSTLT